MRLPLFTHVTVRLALGYLAIGMTAGALMLAGKGLPAWAGVWRLLPLHIDLMLMGGFSQFVMAVMFWIFPRFSEPPRRGKVWLAWVAAGALNAGVLAVVLSDFLPSGERWLVVGRLLELSGAVLFAVYILPRVRPAIRERLGRL